MPHSTPAAISAELAAFMVDSEWTALPASVQNEARRATLNWLGCTLGGCRDDTTDRLCATLVDFAGPPRATLLGRGQSAETLGEEDSTQASSSASRCRVNRSAI